MNTGAAEVLYSAVGEWAQLDQDSTVLDVCCGTGTIGLSLAKVIFVLFLCNENNHAGSIHVFRINCFVP